MAPETHAEDAGQAIAVVHNPERRRYELQDGGKVIGFTKYRFRSNQNQMVFVHTEVDDAYAGQGLASKLARFALDDVRAAGRRIVPLCPYIRAWVRKHPEYLDAVDMPTDQQIAEHDRAEQAAAGESR
ncbi:hypothetical protein D477_017779 [Arthrobacter crystallopoietes BAB-32]|uniref:N-acetyltransferase domain-containing protein n=1 Tax=Arthrobacter crystallopoietes BAB-32 TaxID=1246476 RepID=N1V3T1_9MICC|nr:GNAT family N-acetyltransferase [Arthrobacter crystallopoietes]EMY32898.1 hypothetical protein D477_017779 [Arthrobacter crystallopoietes BAB-32]